MEEELMFMIKNDLCEMNHNGFDIKNIQMYQDMELNWVVSYEYKGQKFIITNDMIESGVE